MNELELKVEKTKREIVELEKELAVKMAFLEGVDAVISSNMIAPEAKQEATTPDAITKDMEFHPEKYYKKGVKIIRIEKVLKDAKKPMHVNHLLFGIGLVVNKKNLSNLSSQLSQKITKGDRFYRPGPGLIGLKEFQNGA